MLKSSLDTKFLSAVHAEMENARGKFPSAKYAMTALTEEVGELAKALLSEPVENIWAEAVQVAVMAMRVATEGDSSLLEWRKRRKLDWAQEWETLSEKSA